LNMWSFRGALKARTRTRNTHSACIWIPGPALRAVPE
jgi:hypothetical protein